MRPARLLLALAALLSVPAAAAWHEARSEHFRIFADADPAALRTYAEQLERFDAAVRALRSLPRDGDDANPLTIYALRNAVAVSNLYGPGGQYIGGWYSPRADGSVAFMPLPARLSRATGGSQEWDIMFHEYTHHLFFRNSPAAYPAWFSEGFAEFLSTAIIRADGSVIFGAALNRRAASLMTDATPVSRLLRNEKPERGEDVERIYAKGWLLTHYLIVDRTRAGQLTAYLKALNAGTPPAEAAKLFGDPDRLDAELNAYLRRSRLETLGVAAARLSAAQVAVTPLTPAEGAMMPMRLRSDRGVDTPQARALLPEARRVGAGAPAEPRVQAWLAEMEFDADNLAGAEAAADRALAARPGDPEALGYRARVALRRWREAKGGERPALLKEARARIVAANRADQDVPRPLVDYYQSFAEAGEALSPAAVAGLRHAYRLAPEADEIRVLVAQQALAEGNLPLARAGLAVLAFNPHGGAAAEAARRAIAVIDGGQRDGLARAVSDALKPVEAPATPKKAPRAAASR